MALHLGPGMVDRPCRTNRFGGRPVEGGPCSSCCGKGRRLAAEARSHSSTLSMLLQLGHSTLSGRTSDSMGTLVEHAGQSM